MPLNVLVIEDDADAMNLVVTLVEQFGHTAYTAENGEVALDMLEQYDFDAFVVDIALPGIDGWGIIQAIRRNPVTAQTPSIAITAFHDSAVEERALSAGFDAYFPKPFEPMEFIRQLESHVG
ncbi:MAG: response regulator [Chloroflexi bacterium]|nr:MAG: response regulator [Chloroflexota bacterium]